MARNDIHGVERAPKSVADYLLKKGGKNPFGEPNFRVVWAPGRMRMRGGRHQDWDKSLHVNERGGLVRTESGLMVPSTCKPSRVFVGVRQVRKYLEFASGWVMERWVPSLYYRGKEEWDSHVVPGTTIPFGGPYPTFGDYEMCHYSPTQDIPSITELQNAIDRCEFARESHQASTHQALLERANQDEWEYNEQLRKEREEVEAYTLDFLKTINSTSLQMGRHRTMLTERAGIREHNGN